MKFGLWTSMCLVMAGLTIIGCGKSDDESKNGKVGAKVRSTGSDLSLMLTRSTFQHFAATNILANAIQNSDVTLDHYKVPISRVNLVSGLTGSGYTQASPDLYTCTGATDDECLINLADKSAVDNLLKTAGKTTEVAAADAEGAAAQDVPEATYNGSSVEFCHESREFSARVKASVKIGATTYYTNATSGVSATGPAQEVKIPVKNIGCGMMTPLFAPLTVTADTNINVVLYTDPAGAVTGLSAPASNIGCVGSSNAICTDPVGIFSTVDEAAPRVERYSLDLGAGKAKGMITLILNSSDEVFGASTRSVHANTTDDTVLAPMTFTEVEKNADGSITLKIWDGSTTLDFISGFKRSSHSGTLKYSSTTAAVAYTATKI